MAPEAVQMGAVADVGRVAEMGAVGIVGRVVRSGPLPEAVPGPRGVDCGAPVPRAPRGRPRLRCDPCKARYKADDRRGAAVRSCPVCGAPAARPRTYCAEHGAGSPYAAAAREARRRGER